MKTPGVIILGCEYQALGLLRQLKSKGVDCVLIDQDKYGPALFSRYKNRFFNSPSYTSSEFWPWLKETAFKNGLEGWVVITTDDEQVRQLAENYEEAVSLFKYAGLPWERYRKIYDKRTCYEWTQSIGLRSPLSYIPFSREDSLNCCLDYPFIVKPAIKREFKKYSNKKAIVVNNREELHDVLFERLRNVPLEELIFQEIIPGDGNYQWSYAGFFVNGEPLAAFTAKRKRQHPPDYGRSSTYVEAIYDPEVEEESLKILSKLKYSGFAEVEWKRDSRDKKLKFLEVNARSWGWHSIAARVVGNLPLLYYNYLTHGECSIKKPEYGVRWVKFVTDIPVVIHLMLQRKLTFRDWYKSIKGNIVSCDWDLTDPAPFFFQFLLIPYLICKRGY
jgi:predicted ATP-grasp superfamily ATP-dependent carboligase